jgi:hypothetical protein
MKPFGIGDFISTLFIVLFIYGIGGFFLLQWMVAAAHWEPQPWTNAATVVMLAAVYVWNLRGAGK